VSSAFYQINDDDDDVKLLAAPQRSSAFCNHFRAFAIKCRPFEIMINNSLFTLSTYCRHDELLSDELSINCRTIKCHMMKCHGTIKLAA